MKKYDDHRNRQKINAPHEQHNVHSEQYILCSMSVSGVYVCNMFSPLFVLFTCSYWPYFPHSLSILMFSLVCGNIMEFICSILSKVARDIAQYWKHDCVPILYKFRITYALGNSNWCRTRSVLNTDKFQMSVVLNCQLN